jgi:hypothetical protein
VPRGVFAQRLAIGAIELEVVGADGNTLGAQVLGQDAADFAVADECDLHAHQSM